MFIHLLDFITSLLANAASISSSKMILFKGALANKALNLSSVKPLSLRLRIAISCSIDAKNNSNLFEI